MVGRAPCAFATSTVCSRTKAYTARSTSSTGETAAAAASCITSSATTNTSCTTGTAAAAKSIHAGVDGDSASRTAGITIS